jgi:hypothetical protein
VPNILNECLANERERFECESKIDMKIERESIKEIMQGKEKRKHFLRYAIEVARKSIGWNKYVRYARPNFWEKYVRT